MECLSAGLLCCDCIVQTHSPDHYLHRILEWKDGWFHSAALCNLGMVATLGHPMGDCPSRAPSRSFDTHIDVVHINGVHQIALSFCGCLNAGDKFVQLLRHRLFPSTAAQPRLAFTFDFLRSFDVHTLVAKTSAYDYMRAVQRITNNAFPHHAKVLVSLRLFLYDS